MNKILKNRSGFTLMEIVIAAGLLGVLAIGFLRFQKTQMKSSKTAINLVEVNNYYNALKSYLAKPGSCKATFSTLGAIKDRLEVESIRRVDGEAKYSVGEKIPGTNFQLTRMVLSDLFINKKEGKEEFRGEVILNIELSRMNNNSYGGKRIKRQLEVDLIVDINSNVIDCGVLGGIYIPTGASTTGTSEDGDPAKKDELDEVFEVSIKQASQVTGENINQEDISKAVKNSPELKKAMESLKVLKEQNQKLNELFQE